MGAGADEGGLALRGDARKLGFRVGMRQRRGRRLQRREDAAVAQQAEAGARAEMELRLLLGLGRQRPHAQRRVRLGPLGARLVEFAVKIERLRAGGPVGEEPGERVGSPKCAATCAP